MPGSRKFTTTLHEISHWICVKTSEICLKDSSDFKFYFLSVENIEISLYAQARQSLLLLTQGNIYNRLTFLNKYLMFLEELNESFRENWSKFLTAGYLVFWKQFPAAGYVDTSFFLTNVHWKYKVWKFINNFSAICAYLFCIVMKLICTLFIQEQFEFFWNAHYFLFSAILSLVGVQVPNVKRWMVTKLFEKWSQNSPRVCLRNENGGG